LPLAGLAVAVLPTDPSIRPTGDESIGGGGFEDIPAAEELEGADGLGGGLAGDFLVALQEDEVLAQFLGRNGLRGLVIMIGELAHAVPIGVAGAVADGAEFEVVGEGD
jgi:hypothetical protein